MPYPFNFLFGPMRATRTDVNWEHWCVKMVQVCVLHVAERSGFKFSNVRRAKNRLDCKRLVQVRGVESDRMKSKEIFTCENNIIKPFVAIFLKASVGPFFSLWTCLAIVCKPKVMSSAALRAESH